MKFRRSCPACRWQFGGGIAEIRMRVPQNITLASEYSIVCCERCGNCFADTPSTADDYKDYYSNHNYYGGGWEYNRSSEHDFEVIVRMLDSMLDKDSSIIDMGCGGGGLLRYLREQGYHHITGIDPSKDSVESLRTDGIKGETGSVYEPATGAVEKADVVIMTMVLEHLLEPDKAINNIKENYLTDNGYILVTWPYFEDLMSDNTPVLNNFNHEHINYFSVQSADWLFERCGFERVDSHISVGFHYENVVMLSNAVMYRCGLSDNSRAVLGKDDKTAGSIAEYCSRAGVQEAEFVSRINRLADSGEKTVVWGTGAYLMHLAAVSRLFQCDIAYIVDNNRLKQGQRLYGYEVCVPERLKDFRGTTVITSMLYAEDIEKQIREMGNDFCKILRR